MSNFSFFHYVSKVICRICIKMHIQKLWFLNFLDHSSTQSLEQTTFNTSEESFLAKWNDFSHWYRHASYDLFWSLYSRWLFKTWKQKENLFKTSNFFFCHNVLMVSYSGGLLFIFSRLFVQSSCFVRCVGVWFFKWHLFLTKRLFEFWLY